MDPLTHAISGAALARAMPQQPLPRGQFILIILLAMAPDADYVLKFISDMTYLEHHRGVTHSILMLPLWTWLIYALLPHQAKLQPIMPWLLAAAIAMHILLDVITSFGTMVLAPLSDWRAALDLVFIIDPLFTALMLLPLLLGLIWKRQRRPLAITSLALCGGYLLLTTSQHERAIDVARQQFPQATGYAALPYPFSPFHWQVIAETPQHYQRTYIDLEPAFPGGAILFPKRFADRFLEQLSPASRPLWHSFRKMEGSLWQANRPGIAFYHWFARYPVILKETDSLLEIGDLRFGSGTDDEEWAFRLRVEKVNGHRAWLIWRGDRMSELR